MKNQLDPEIIQPSQIPIQRESTTDNTVQDILDVEEKFWSNYDAKFFYNYKKGSVFAQNIIIGNENDDAYPFLRGLNDCIFQYAREIITKDVDNIEERQRELLKVSLIENINISILKMLEELDIKLDKDSVVPIIYGYMNTCMRKTITK